MQCPFCQQEVKKTPCKFCNRNFHIFKDKEGVVVTYQKSPLIEIASHFEKLMTNKLSEEHNRRIPFRIKRKGITWRSELSWAKNLLREVDYDLDLLLEVMDYLTTNKKFSWAINSSISNYMKSLNVGIAIIKSKREKEAKEQERRLRMEQALANRDEIFNG